MNLDRKGREGRGDDKRIMQRFEDPQKWQDNCRSQIKNRDILNYRYSLLQTEYHYCGGKRVMLNLLLFSVAGIPEYISIGAHCVKAAFGTRALGTTRQKDGQTDG